jgi:hypothetical protein
MKRQFSRESSSFRGSLAMFAALALGAFACAPSVPLQHRPCPCADGWICCPSDDMCAPDANSCSGGGGTAGTGGATSGGAAGTAMQHDASVADVQVAPPLDGGFAGASPGGSAGSAPPPSDAGLPTLPNPTYTVQSSFLGTWSGYFENFAFPSTSDGIRLSIAQNADGSGKISVVLGMGPPPAPPTSADATWPPIASSDPRTVLTALMTLPESYIEGFAYDAYAVQVDSARVRFIINDSEPWQTYCQLQTSYYVTSEVPAGYECTPGGGGGGGGDPLTCASTNAQGVSVPVSCMQVFACGRLCACDAVGCGAQVRNTTSFDITFTGPKGAGNVTIANGDGRDVMLTQVATADGGQP